MSDEGVVKYLPVRTNEVADVLRRARALVDTPEKWCQFIQQDEGGRLCAIGAIVKASGGTPYYAGGECNDPPEIPAFHALASVVAKPNSYDPIARWNNAPERAHADILRAFDRAIALSESS